MEACCFTVVIALVFLLHPPIDIAYHFTVSS